MVGQLYWVCEPIGHKWKDETAPQCPLGLQVVICQVICKSQMCMVFKPIFLKFNLADVVADSILLFFPLKIFQTLTDRALRRRLMIIFSTCIATTIVSLVHAAYIIASENIQILISAEVEVCKNLKCEKKKESESYTDFVFGSFACRWLSATSLFLLAHYSRCDLHRLQS